MPTEDISMTMNVLPGTFAGLTAAAAGMNQIVGLVNTLANRVGQTTSILDSMLVTFSAGVTYAGFEASKAAGEFERAMKMVKVVSGQSVAEIDVLSRKANELSVQFKMGIDDITDGLQTLGRAGLGSLDTQISVLETGLSAAKLSGLELNKVLQDIVQTTSLLGGDITSTSFGSQADALTNKILATSMTAPINMNDIVQTLSYSGGTAAAAGINIENEDALYDYLGTISAFARKGVSGSMAGTALRAFFTKPASQDESVKGAFETLGLQAEDLWKNNGQEMRKVSEQIQIIHDAMNKKHMSTLDQIETWGKIVGNKMGQQMMKLDESNIRQVTQEIQESENATKLAHESMQNFASDLATLEQRGQAMWRSFGQAALTVFRPIVEGLKAITALISPDTTSGTIFSQLIAGGIIIIISQVIARLGTAWRLIKSIAGEMRKMVNESARTPKTIEAQRAKQMEVYKAMGLTDKQADRLAKDAKNTGFNIQFMSTAMTEFLAKLNEVVTMMGQLVSQTEILARMPLGQGVSRQYNRFYSSRMGAKKLDHTNYGALVPVPTWLDNKRAAGNTFGVRAGSPYMSDLTHLAETHGLRQDFLKQLYTGTLSKDYQRKYGFDSPDVFKKWLDKNPSMVHSKEVSFKDKEGNVVGKGTAVMIPLTSLDSFLKEHNLSYKTQGQGSSVSSTPTQPQPKIDENGYVWSQDKTARQHELRMKYDKEYAAQIKAQEQITKTAQNEEKSKRAKLEAEYKQIEEEAAKEVKEELARKNQPKTQEDATKQRTEAIKNETKASEKAAQESSQAAEAYNKAAKNQIKISKRAEAQAAYSFGRVFNIDKSSKELTEAFTKKYGMTPEEYDKRQATYKTPQQYANLQALANEKEQHLQTKKQAQTELSQVRAQLHAERSTLKGAQKFAGEGRYAEIMFKRLGLKSASQEFITDMEKLAKVSKKVADTQNLTFTKIGNVSKPQTEDEKEYNALRTRLRRQGLLDKRITTAKDTYKFASGQTKIAEDNKQLIQRYQVEKKILEEESKRQGIIKTLEEREAQLSSIVNTEQQKIVALNKEIQMATGSVKEFSAALNSVQNKNAVKNPYAHELEKAELDKAAKDRKRIDDAVKREERMAANQEKVDKQHGLRTSRKEYGASAREKQVIADSIKAGQEANAKAYTDFYNQEKTAAERRLGIRPTAGSQPKYDLNSTAAQNFANTMKKADTMAAKSTANLQSNQDKAAAGFGKLMNQADKLEKQSAKHGTTSLSAERAGMRSFGQWLDRANAQKESKTTYFDTLYNSKQAHDAAKKTNTSYYKALGEIDAEKQARERVSEFQTRGMGGVYATGRRSTRMQGTARYQYDMEKANSLLGRSTRRLGERVNFFTTTMKKQWGIEDKAMQNARFGSRLTNSLNKHIIEPIGRTNLAKSVTQAFNQKFIPEKLQLENTKMLSEAAKKAQSAGYGFIPPHLLSRGPVTDELGQAGVGRAGLNKWLTRGGMLNWVNHEELKATHTEAQKAWNSGKKLSAAGKMLGGTLGSVSMLFGPIEAAMMAVSVAQMLYTKGLEAYNQKLTELQSKLSESIDSYDKAIEEFTSSFSKNKDDITKSQEEVSEGYDKYIEKASETDKKIKETAAKTTSLDAKAAKGVQFFGGSRKVENAIMTIAQARESGQIAKLDEQTIKIHEALLRIRSDTNKLAEQQSDGLYGTQGWFTNFFDSWDNLWNWGSWNDDMTVFKNSSKDFSAAGQLALSSWQQANSNNIEEFNPLFGGLLSMIKTEGSPGGLVRNTLDYEKGHDGTGDFLRNERLENRLFNRHLFGQQRDIGAYDDFIAEFGKNSQKEQNQIAIALKRNEKDFKYLGKLMLHENTNSGRINTYIKGLGLKTGLTQIQIKQAAILQAVADMQDIATNTILPQMKDNAMNAYQTLLASTSTAGSSAGSLDAENSIYAAANMIATNVAILASNAIDEQAYRDAAPATYLGMDYDQSLRIAQGGGSWFENAWAGLTRFGNKDSAKLDQELIDVNRAQWAGYYAGGHDWNARDFDNYITQQKQQLRNQGMSDWEINVEIKERLREAMADKAAKDLIENYESMPTSDDEGSGGGSGSGTDKDKDKDKSSGKNWVNLAICNKKEIPKLNVNLFKKPPNFTILNRNFKLRDVNVNTADDAKSIQNAVKNSIIEIQNRSNPKIIQDDSAEYDPVNATEGNTLPTGTKKTE